MKIKFPELPYAYNALDVCIDAQTMDLHYNKHHRKYYEKFMGAIETTDKIGIETLEEIFPNISSYEPSIRNNGGGLYNHNFFWNSMTPNYRDCVGELRSAIEKKWKTSKGKSSIQFDISQIDSGVYFVLLKTPFKTYSQKIIKE